MNLDLSELLGWPPDPPSNLDQDPKRFYGVTSGRVINLIDPMFLGRVQIQLPFIDFLDLSPWARIAVPMSGPLCGLAFLPQIGDEVLVAFEHGDINVPYIIGSLWNGFAPPLPNFPVPDSPVRTSYSMRTLLGNQLVMEETPPTLTIQNGPTPPVLPAPPVPGPYQTLALTPAGIVATAATVEIVTPGGTVTVTPAGVVIAGATLTLAATTALNLTAPAINITASADCTITGAMVIINP
jgi:Type VI secretion system/phage-baseplate injector OB domain